MILLIALGAGIFVKSYTSKDAKTIGGEVLHQIKDYRHVESGQVTCNALVPECGYCNGEVVDKKCYEKENN